MQDALVKVAADSTYISEFILGALFIMVTFLSRRELKNQDRKIEVNNRAIRDIDKRSRKTDQHIAEIHSDLSYIRGVLDRKNDTTN